MIKVSKALYSILSSDVPLVVTLTEGSVIKVFPLEIPQRTSLPAVVYSVVSNTPHDDKDGPSTFDQVRVQVDSYARTYNDCADLASKVRDALDRVTPGTYNSVIVKGTRYISSNMQVIEDDNVYRISEDYQIIINPQA